MAKKRKSVRGADAASGKGSRPKQTTGAAAGKGSSPSRATADAAGEGSLLDQIITKGKMARDESEKPRKR